MKTMYLFLLGLSLSIVAEARRVTEPPKMGPAAEDKQLSLAYLEARVGSSTLASARNSHREVKHQFETLLDQFKKGMVSGAAVDAKEQELEAVRQTYLQEIDKTGLCGTKEVDLQEYEKPGISQRWYVSLGACALKSDKFFAKAKDWLRDIRHYSQKSGGFRNILAFIGVDKTTKTLLEETWTPSSDAKTFATFVAVKAVDLWGLVPSFTYLIDNFVDQKSDEKAEEFILSFQNLQDMSGFETPDVVEEVSAAGTPTTYDQKQIRPVWGRWYLKWVKGSGSQPKIYVSYETAANFASYAWDLKYARNKARYILLNTMIQLIEKTTPEVLG